MIAGTIKIITLIVLILSKQYDCSCCTARGNSATPKVVLKDYNSLSPIYKAPSQNTFYRTTYHSTFAL